MYAAHFGLSREPFSLAPDPRFLFMSERHREALAHLLYGVRGGGGFVLLTGEIGAGKTTVVRAFLEQLPPQCVVAYVFNPSLTVIELLQTITGEFGIAPLPPEERGSVKAQVDALNRFLLGVHAEGRQALLIIDEAQALDATLLEQLRLLTNLETAERKLLQIVLVGQPELRARLAEPGLEQLAQRVIARCHLGPLTAAETQQYVEHRLGVAGLAGAPPFDAAAMVALHALTGGVPRKINLLADRALLGSYGQGQRVVGHERVQQAAHEVFDAGPAAAGGWRSAGGGPVGRRGPGGTWLNGPGPVVAAAAGLIVLGLGLGLLLSPVPGGSTDERPPDASTAAVAPASSVAAETPAAPRQDSLESLFAAAPADEALAWRELALRWNLAIGEGEPCAVAAQAGLACYRSASGGLALMRTLDRPAWLALRRPDGASALVLLTGLGATEAVLEAGGRRHVLPLSALAGLWRGDFATWWMPPPGARSDDTARQGWLKSALDTVLPPGPGASLPERVAAFQLLAGLPVDGQAGPLTLMQLSRAAGVAEPRLGVAATAQEPR
jgi:general secretion pathway protein A